jgi:hypothetical protein
MNSTDNTSKEEKKSKKEKQKKDPKDSDQVSISFFKGIISAEGRERTVLTIIIIFFVTFSILSLSLLITPFGRKILEKQILGIEPSSTASFIPGPSSESVMFKRTFIFWVPKNIGLEGMNPHPEESYNILHRWLILKCGGYTRWDVEGGKHFVGRGNLFEKGFMYQVSITADRDLISKKDIYGHVASTFDRQSLYIIEINHSK